MTDKLFDLNIEEMLENWEIHHAIREVIANALDEQFLSDTEPIEIFRDDEGRWHVRDYGRGLEIEDFTMSEDPEKLNASGGVIGSFGVGLKDALATFYRRGVDVEIRSSQGIYHLSTAEKHNFDEIETLHVVYDDAPTDLQGTDFVFSGVSQEDVDLAKSLFMAFAGENVIETTPYGQIMRRHPQGARVYIQGVLANEEPNFLFSYNITDLTPAMKKRLNRERFNVGRTVYAPRIRSILKEAESALVHERLVDAVRAQGTGSTYDELGWIEISQMALNLMPKQQKVVYFTEDEIESRPDVLSSVLSEGYEPVTITEQQKERLERQERPDRREQRTMAPDETREPAQRGADGEVRTVVKYVEEFRKSFEYQFVGPVSLDPEEQAVYERTREIEVVVGLDPDTAPEVRISETLPFSRQRAGGTWDPALRAVIIARSKLASLPDYAATLLHELVRATAQVAYLTPEFERVLTQYLGRAVAAAVGEGDLLSSDAVEEPPF